VPSGRVPNTIGWAAIGLIVAAAPAPASAACGGVKRARAAKNRTPGRAPLAIGDSVMLGAVPEVARAGFEVNVRGCRQMSEALRLMRGRKGARTLPRYVVIALGANGPIRGSEVRAAMRIVGRRRVLGLLTPRRGDDGDATLFRGVARRHRRRVQLLDWARHTAGRSGWFSGDGLHLGAGGAAAMGRMLRRSLRRVYPLRLRWRRRKAEGGRP
jgi:hypothetical protein